jgi:mRNA interferase RelE/StbE
MAFYRVEVTNEARKEIRNVSGHLRARILEVLRTLEHTYNPPGSRQLDLTKLEEPSLQEISLWRMRLDTWRVIYAVNSKDNTISVLAIRQRPPYQYEDLKKILRSYL